MLASLHPFDIGLDVPARTTHFRPRARTASRDPAMPRVNTFADADGYTIILSSPHERIDLADVRLAIDGQSLMLKGTAFAAGSSSYKYQAQDAVPLFAEPNRTSLLGYVRPGTIVCGSAPSSRGWIALDDDESWMNEHLGSLICVQDAGRQPISFERRVELPADADLGAATRTWLKSGEFLVSVPRRVLLPVHRPERTARATTSSHGIHRPATSSSAHGRVGKAMSSPLPTPSRSAETVVANVAQEPPPTRQAPTGVAAKRKAPSPPAPANGHVQPVNGSRSEDRRDHLQPNPMREELRKVGEEPLLTTCPTPEASNIASPSETCEHWAATPDGGFALLVKA